MLHFILVVVVIGLVLWAVNAYVPMDARIKNFLSIAVVILLVIWFLSLLGVLGGSLDAPFPRL